MPSASTTREVFFSTLEDTNAAPRNITGAWRASGMRRWLSRNAAPLADQACYRLALAEKRTDDVRSLLVQAESMSAAGKASAAGLGYIYLRLGEADTAARWISAAAEARDPYLVWPEYIDFEILAANPKTQPVLNQPGLKELHDLRRHNARANLR